MSDATTTPVDPSSAPSIREEIQEVADLGSRRHAQVVDRLNEICAALGPIADATGNLDATVARIVVSEGERLQRRIVAAVHADVQTMLDARDQKLREERNADVQRLDERIDALSLRTGASLSEAEVDAAKTAALAKKNADDMAVFTRGRMGFGLGSAAIALAAKSGLSWADVKAWAWSHGLLLTVAGVVALAAVVVEIAARLRKKGQS